MILNRITVKNFGSVKFYDAVLTSELNILNTPFPEEISTAIELVLCSKTVSELRGIGVENNTLITAEVTVADNRCSIELKPLYQELLNLTAWDDKGNDVTNFYCTLTSHCTEEDAMDHFNGNDNSLPLRLCRYRGCGEYEIPKELQERSNYLVRTETFRSYLVRYMKAFEPESIHNIKQYKATINHQGKFELVFPEVSQEPPLSPTEERLFWYVCFLNIAQFWADVESIRNMHHEKKPLIIQNFLEFLDLTTDLKGLFARTSKLKRQVIILTLPIKKSLDKKWVGKNNEHTNIYGTQKQYK